MAKIPDGASVATDKALAPQLTSRTDVYLLPHAAKTEWTLAFTSQPESQFGSQFGSRLVASEVFIDGPLVLIHRGH